jgi:SNF2 family DNA or RNA helicase
VLLSSEVGSEGLDFQFCHALVNWDLPWNPMVVEQRIGRLDRLGQKSEKILIFSFSCPDTIEDVILQRLYSRIGVFERTIGVLEPILGQEIKELTEQLFANRLTPAEREQIIEARARALAQRARDEERRRIWLARMSSSPSRLTECEGWAAS